MDVAESAVIHGAQFFRILSTDYIRLYEGTIEMLTVLKEKGKKLYLLSNAQRIYTEYEMNALGITDFLTTFSSLLILPAANRISVFFGN